MKLRLPLKCEDTSLIRSISLCPKIHLALIQNAKINSWREVYLICALHCTVRTLWMWYQDMLEGAPSLCTVSTSLTHDTDAIIITESLGWECTEVDKMYQGLPMSGGGWVYGIISQIRKKKWVYIVVFVVGNILGMCIVDQLVPFYTSSFTHIRTHTISHILSCTRSPSIHPSLSLSLSLSLPLPLIPTCTLTHTVPADSEDPKCSHWLSGLDWSWNSSATTEGRWCCKGHWIPQERTRTFL